MKKPVCMILLIGIALIFLGGCVFFGVFAYARFDPSIFDTVGTVNETCPVSEEFNAISVNIHHSIRIDEAKDGVCRVEYNGGDLGTRTVAVKDGVLTVEERDNGPFHGIYLHRCQFVLYLPAGSYQQLDVQSSTGFIAVVPGFTFENARIGSSTGSINFRAEVRDTLTISSSTGLVSVSSVSCRHLRVVLHTGDVLLEKINALEDAVVDASTGKVTVNDLRASSFSVKTSTGPISLTDVISTGQFSANASTGSIRLTCCDGAEVVLRTRNGSIRGSLCSGKEFTAHSRYGSVRVPASTPGGGVCKADSLTGSIDLTVE